MRQKHRFGAASGYTILIVIVFLIIIFVFVMLLNSVGIQNIGIVKTHISSNKALYAAESGIARAVSDLKRNRYWDGTVDGSGSPDRLKYSETKMPSSNDTYTVRVYNNFAGSGVLEAEMGIRVPKGACFVISKGKSGVFASKYVGVMIVSEPIYEYGIFANEQIETSGNISILAYDSNSGISVPGAAHIASNGVQRGTVTMNGSPQIIDGNILVGSEADILNDNPVLIHGHPVITGTIGNLSRDKLLKDVVIPKNLPVREISGDTLLPGDYSSHGEFRIGNNNYKLMGSPGGSQYIFDGIRGTGQGKIEIDATNGPVKIYLTNNVTFSGQSGITITYQQTIPPRPGDLQILADNNVDSIEITGISNLLGTVYAPETTFSLTGVSQFSGAVVSNEIIIRGNTKLNYDVNLKTLQDGTELVVGSWQYF